MVPQDIFCSIQILQDLIVFKKAIFDVYYIVIETKKIGKIVSFYSNIGKNTKSTIAFLKTAHVDK